MSYEFLKYFITEPIYLIQESDKQESEDPVIEEEPESSVESPVLEPEHETTEQANEPAPKELVEVGSSNEVVSEKEGTKILVIVRYPYIETLPNNEKILLEKILKSAIITFEDITLINVAHNKIPDKSALSAYTHILIFDNEPTIIADLTLKKENYSRQQIGEVNYVIADPLESIHEDIAKKMLLWKVLKTVFDV